MSESNPNENNISSELSDIFDLYPFYENYEKALVIKVSNDILYLVNENFNLVSVSWTSDFNWARQRISINELGPVINGFKDIIKFGDLIYLKNNGEFYSLDQIPEAESSLISINPKSGEVLAYIGGKNFSESNFDRVRLSFPQSGSSFKPFIYTASLANGYNLSSLINDAPIVFQDENLESAWKPQNYTGEFYGPISLREALIKSVNIVSIKLLRELGIDESLSYLQKFGFEESRLPKDLSLALGSANFSPAEMVRGYSVIANDGYISNMHFIDSIIDREGNYIYSQNKFNAETLNQNTKAFPWLNTVEMNIKKPYYLLKPIQNESRVVDQRVSFLIEDTLKDFMKNGVAGRKSQFLNRNDIGGKTGTTNNSISTWFSGFHNNLVTTVWVGTDDFTSLGQNEYGSTIALPIWLNYMEFKLNDLEVSNKVIPENISFVKVSSATGEIDEESDENTYFELFLNENIN